MYVFNVLNKLRKYFSEICQYVMYTIGFWGGDPDILDLLYRTFIV